MERKLIVYIACSLDGYIAAPGDDLSFLDAVAREGEDYGYGAFIQTVDTVIMGRKTYDWVMDKVPGYRPEKPTYIISRSPRIPEGNALFYHDDLLELVRQLKKQPGRHIFCDGGAAVIDALLQDDLVDEFIISIIPVLLGNGIRLFRDGRPAQKLSLSGSRAFSSGLVQLHYVKPLS